jgi:hypothetical protein
MNEQNNINVEPVIEEYAKNYNLESYSLHTDVYFARLIAEILKYHIQQKTNIYDKLPFNDKSNFIQAYDIVRKYSNYTDDENVQATLVLDYIFYVLTNLLRNIRKAMKRMSKGKYAVSVSNAQQILNTNVDLITYIVLTNSTIIPWQLQENIKNKLDIVSHHEEHIINQCKTILRKAYTANNYYVCDFNRKYDYPSPSCDLDGFICQAKKYISKRKVQLSQNFINIINDNIPLTSPYAIIVLIGIITYLRNTSVSLKTRMKRG